MTSNMKIGIDCRTILNPGFGEKAGVGHYTFFLADKLLDIDRKNDYVLFFDDLVSREAIERFIRGRRAIGINFPFYRYKKFMPFAYSQILLAALMEKEGLDLLHSPANTAPLAYTGKSVVTIHDLAVYKHPEWFPKKYLSRQFSTKITVPKSLKKADRVIAVSGSTKKDIIELFNIPENKIKVVYEGVSFKEPVPEGQGESCGRKDRACFQDVKIRHGLMDRYFLFMGTIEPRKNIKALVQSFSRLVRNNDMDDLQLVIAGARGWKYKEVFDEIEKFRLGQQIRYLGYVPQKEKAALMRNSLAFVFPSLYEGFGLPVLEAMSLGCVVISSRVSSLPEVVGKAGLLVGLKGGNALAEAMKRVAEDPKLRGDLRKKAIGQAAKFSWEKCAEETLEVYKSV